MRRFFFVLLVLVIVACGGGGDGRLQADSYPGGVTVVGRVAAGDCRQLGAVFGVCNTSGVLEKSASIMWWSDEYGWVPVFGTVLVEGEVVRPEGVADGFVLWTDGDYVVVGIEAPMTRELLDGDGQGEPWPDFSRPGVEPVG